MRFLRYILIICALLITAALLFPDVASDGEIPLRFLVKVTDAISGDPIEGATVVLISARNNRNPELYTPPEQAIGTTDKHGFVSVWDHFPAGWSTFRGGVILEGATITVSASGYESASQPASDKKKVRYWNFWRPHFPHVFELKKK